MPQAIAVTGVGHDRADRVDQSPAADGNGHAGALSLLIELAVLRQETIPIQHLADGDPQKPRTKFGERLPK